jgi:hypothetical protein
MYCKHCGKEIIDDSKFCNHCGKSQDNGNKTVVNYPIWIIYIVWALANFYLLMGEKSRYTSDAFYPFTKITRSEDDWGHFYVRHEYWDKFFYDFSEFIVYVFVVPAILYGIYKLICKRKADNSK